VTLRLGDYKAGPHNQRGEDLKHMGIKADGVTEHYVVSVGCRRGRKRSAYVKTKLLERKKPKLIKGTTKSGANTY
jgi:hypothetical protein